jgi:hypothetical protein
MLYGVGIVEFEIGNGKSKSKNVVSAVPQGF